LGAARRGGRGVCVVVEDAVAVLLDLPEDNVVAVETGFDTLAAATVVVDRAANFADAEGLTTLLDSTEA